MTITNDTHICPFCQVACSRYEHLQRHLVSHASAVLFRCEQCQRPFGRKDSLTRHLKRCALGSPRSSLSTRRACHRCAIKKRRCPQQRPSCMTCQKAGELCSYPAVFDEALSSIEPGSPISLRSEHNGILPKDLVIREPNLDPTHPIAHRERAICEEEVIRDHGYRIHYMERDTSLGKTFKNQQMIQFKQAAASGFNPSIDCVLHTSVLSPATSFDFLIHFTKCYDLQASFRTHDIFHGAGADISHVNWVSRESDVMPVDNVCAFVSEDDYDPAQYRRGSQCVRQRDRQSIALSRSDALTLKAKEIWSILRSFTPEWSHRQEAQCVAFFSSENVAHFLDLYWMCWYPNWPVIHKPLFQAGDCPISLLTAMIVIGACHSVSEADRHNARYWFTAVEQYTFHCLTDMKQVEPYRRLQYVQAAFLVCIYQTWDGKENDRVRIRRHGFRKIVDAVRDIDMSSARHITLSDFDEFDWPEFVRMEETIRTLIWVFCLDTAFVIFNNMPPQFALRELRMGLPSCEAIFQASSAWECFSRLQTWSARKPQSPYSTVYGLIRSIFNDNMTEQSINDMAHESYLNLWCLTAAFHVILFNMDFEFTGKEQFSKVQTGLNNWKEVWKRRFINKDEHFFDIVVVHQAPINCEYLSWDLWKRPGFWKYAAEYWLLAQLMLERMTSAQKSVEAANTLSGADGPHHEVASHINNEIEDGGMRRLRAFLLSC